MMGEAWGGALFTKVENLGINHHCMLSNRNPVHLGAVIILFLDACL